MLFDTHYKNPNIMKRYILFASIVIIAFAANGQVNDIPLIGNKFTFGIDGGLALPVSQFGSSGPNSPLCRCKN